MQAGTTLRPTWSPAEQKGCVRRMSRIESRDPSPRMPSRARAFVYVATCRDEDIRS
jgi:hypothetical protein